MTRKTTSKPSSRRSTTKPAPKPQSRSRSRLDASKPTIIEGDSLVKDAIRNKKRQDGWSNVLTGLGRKDKDARLAQQVEWNRMTEHDLDHLYAGDAMAAKIVDMPVDDALDGGYEWKGISKDQAKKLNTRLKELNFNQAINLGCKKGRHTGGSGILKVYNDDLRLETPPAEGKKVLKSLIVLHRFELFAMYEDVDKDLLSATFGKPILFTFQGRNESQVYTKIHTKRLEKFYGSYLPDNLYQANGYWYDSVLSRPYEAIRNYSFAHDGVNAALKDLSVAVFKMKDLANNLAADCDDAVIKRVDIVNMCKSIARAVVLDAEGEDFDYKVRNLTGAGDLVDRAESRLAAEVSMPKTILFGTSPKGSLGGGTSGDHELENWYNFLESFQKNHLRDPMLNIAKEVCEELGIAHEELDIEFAPLWQLSEKEEAELRKTQSETDQRYIELGVLDPSEVRTSRFTGDKYTIETTIDESISTDDLGADDELEKEIEALTKKKMSGATDPTVDPASTSTIDPATSKVDPAQGEVQSTALNGAQVTSLVGVIQELNAGQMTREQAIGIIGSSFPALTPEQVNQIVGSGKILVKPEPKQTNTNPSTEE